MGYRAITAAKATDYIGLVASGTLAVSTDAAAAAAAVATSAAVGVDESVRDLLMRATIVSIVAPSSSETSPSRKFCKPWSLL